jgi:hypothetical protein
LPQFWNKVKPWPKCEPVFGKNRRDRTSWFSLNLFCRVAYTGNLRARVGSRIAPMANGAALRRGIVASRAWLQKFDQYIQRTPGSSVTGIVMFDLRT